MWNNIITQYKLWKTLHVYPSIRARNIKAWNKIGEKRTTREHRYTWYTQYGLCPCEGLHLALFWKIDLWDYMESSHMHHINLHHPIMSQSCVYKWHVQHVMCDEVQSTHTQKGLLYLSYIPRDMDYITYHNTCGINEFTPLYIENG